MIDDDQDHEIDPADHDHHDAVPDHDHVIGLEIAEVEAGKFFLLVEINTIQKLHLSVTGVDDHAPVIVHVVIAPAHATDPIVVQIDAREVARDVAHVVMRKRYLSVFYHFLNEKILVKP